MILVIISSEYNMIEMTDIKARCRVQTHSLFSPYVLAQCMRRRATLSYKMIKIGGLCMRSPVLSEIPCPFVACDKPSAIDHIDLNHSGLPPHSPENDGRKPASVLPFVKLLTCHCTTESFHEGKLFPHIFLALIHLAIPVGMPS